MKIKFRKGVAIQGEEIKTLRFAHLKFSLNGENLEYILAWILFKTITGFALITG